MSSVTVIGRRGTMRDGEHHSTEVIVELVDAEDVVIGRGSTEKKAAAAARAELKRFRLEQKALDTPAVRAARAALVAALKEAQEG